MKNNILNEIVEWFSKNAALFMSIGIGLTAKVAIDAKNGKKLTTKQLVITIILSCFIGYWSGVLVEYAGHENMIKVVVPMATLLGESITVWAIVNCHKYLTKVADYFFTFNKKEK